MELIILGILGFLGSILSSFTGGGAAMLMLPLMIFLGYAPTTAIGTIKFGALGLQVGSISKFVKHPGHINKKIIKVAIPLVIAAGVIGPLIVTDINESIVEVIISVVLIVASLAMLLQIKSNKSRYVPWLGYPLYFFLAMIQAAIGSGAGTLITIVMISLLGLTPLQAIATKRVIGVSAILVPLTIFWLRGSVDVAAGVVLLISMLAGGFVGTHFSIKKGDKVVKYTVAGGAMILAVLLIIF